MHISVRGRANALVRPRRTVALIRRTQAGVCPCNIHSRQDGRYEYGGNRAAHDRNANDHMHSCGGLCKRAGLPLKPLNPKRMDENRLNTACIENAHPGTIVAFRMNALSGSASGLELHAYNAEVRL